MYLVFLFLSCCDCTLPLPSNWGLSTSEYSPSDSGQVAVMSVIVLLGTTCPSAAES